MPVPTNIIGNPELLSLYNTAFLCSRKIPAGIVLKSYDWAIAQRNAGNCVISGFQSPIEKDVLHFLLKGNQPIIVVLARKMITIIPAEFKAPLDQDRLLVISPPELNQIRITEKTALIRNTYMAEIADEIFVPYFSEGGQIEKIIRNINNKKIRIGFGGI